MLYFTVLNKNRLWEELEKIFKTAELLVAFTDKVHLPQASTLWKKIAKKLGFENNFILTQEGATSV